VGSWSDQELEAKQIEPDPALGVFLETEHGQSNLLKELLKNYRETGRVCLFPSPERTHEVFLIDWAESNTALIRHFLAWLEINRPPGAEESGLTKGGGPTRGFFHDLNALAARRLLHAYRGDWTACPPLYGTHSSWLKAKARADFLIAAISGQ
jgi:hypothetical protein